MSLRNRVSPEGTIESSRSRGTVMGNRGLLHNSNKELKRLFKTKAWITCVLEFKGRRRELMSPNAYTELFFLDEVTAFAAGHRPCAECRRARYNEFRDAWAAANQWQEDSVVKAPQMDEILHRERLENNQKVTWPQSVSELPHGAMFRVGDENLVVHDGEILKWSFEGWGLPGELILPETVEVLTPRSVVKAFKGGFKPEFHSSSAG